MLHISLVNGILQGMYKLAYLQPVNMKLMNNSIANVLIGASISESHTCRCVRSSISLYPNFGMFGMFGTGTSPLILPTLPFDLANIAFDLTANHCPLISPT